MTTPDNKKLFTFEFFSLNLVIFFAFCNMAVFYSFFSYLERIDIPAEWRGFLVGLEPMSAFVLRLAAVPMLHVGNAATAMLIALTGAEPVLEPDVPVVAPGESPATSEPATPVVPAAQPTLSAAPTPQQAQKGAQKR